MKPKVLADTGPLVAALDRRDAFHSWAVAEGERVLGHVVTCEAVITEACYLLGRMPAGVNGLFDMLSRGDLIVAFHLENEVSRVHQLMTRYANVPMSLADACLVRMAEIHNDATVWTLDGDFRIYRKHNRQVIPTVMPER